MAGDRVQRRLAAILAADVVRSTRRMKQAEAGTLAALKNRREGVIDPIVVRHQGRIFQTAGDGVMVEFGSVVNAMQCAIVLQHEMAAANAGQPDERHIVMRIGVNLGDVVVEGNDLYGDGVNVAARLEQLAEPGSIWVSASVYDQVKRRLDAAFDELGPQAIRNITDPVHVYRLLPRQPDDREDGEA